MSERPEAPETVDEIVAAVTAVPGVHGLHGGVLGEVATYLPGRRVHGVRLRPDGCDVHVVLDWGAPVGETTGLVRAAVRPYADGRIDVTVEDVAAPGA
jgi:uncharacterized alkaline shock family protein YloU